MWSLKIIIHARALDVYSARAYCRTFQLFSNIVQQKT